MSTTLHTVLAWSIFLLFGAGLGKSCGHREVKNHFQLQDYILWPHSDTNYFRVFEHYDGEWVARMYLNQQLIADTDSGILVSHYWLHGDSTPINRSTEFYGRDNTVTYVSQSYFEPNAIGLFDEHQAELLPPNTYGYNDPDLEMNVFYAFKKDTKATMNFDAKISYSLEQRDTLDSIFPVLVLRSDETIHMNYTDKRENMLDSAYSELVYKYKQGLIQIKQSNSRQAVEYNIAD